MRAEGGLVDLAPIMRDKTLQRSRARVRAEGGERRRPVVRQARFNGAARGCARKDPMTLKKNPGLAY